MPGDIFPAARGARFGWVLHIGINIFAGKPLRAVGAQRMDGHAEGVAGHGAGNKKRPDQWVWLASDLDHIAILPVEVREAGGDERAGRDGDYRVGDPVSQVKGGWCVVGNGLLVVWVGTGCFGS